MGDGGAGRRQAERDREALREQARQFDEAQRVLGKGRDESISDIEAAEARLQGLITDEQEAIITTLNQGSGSAIETLTALQEQLDSQLESAQTNILDTIAGTAALTSDEIRQEVGAAIGDTTQAEAAILQNVVDTGLLAREALSDQFLQGIQDLTGFSQEAVETLRPFQEQGERSLLQARVLSGTATQQERQEFEDRFGGLESSPLVQARIEEEERAIGRQQRALGRRFSGLGQEEILERGSRRIREEELARQLGTATQLAGLGAGVSGQIAGIQQQTGRDILGARQGLGQSLSNQLQQQAGLGAQIGTQALAQRNQLREQLAQQLEANRARQLQLQTGVGQQFALNRANLGQQLGANIGNIQLGTAGNIANLQQNLLNQRLNLGSQFVGARSNIRTGQGSNIANLIAQNALSQTQGAIRANALQAQSETSLLGDIAGALGTGVGFFLGGPQGAAAGAQIGGALGGSPPGQTQLLGGLVG